jgi:polar amino acid transport system substrate-binding protein
VRASGLRVGFDNENPWDYTDSSGNFTGNDVEIAKTCATQLGINQVIPELAQWDALVPGLVSGRWDVIAAGMSLTPDRLQVAIATQQMYGFGAKVLVQKGNPLKLHSWDDVAKSGETVAMVTGGNYQTTVEKMGIKVKDYPSLDAEIQDLLAGRVKIVANAELSLAQYVQQNPSASVEVADPWDYQGIGTSQPALYFNKSDADLRDAFNNCITNLKTGGQLATILTKFGFDATTIPSPGPGQP